MSETSLDSGQYCARLGLDAKLPPTVETLKRIVERHTHEFSFENLDSFCGEQVSLGLQDIARKFLHAGRGGYCFEHNTLLWAVLEDFGFGVTGMAARVRWNVPAERRTPLGHMLLKVTVGAQRFLVDAGFGGITVTAPLELDCADPQKTSHEDFWINQQGDLRTLLVDIQGAWKPLYQFDERELARGDYEPWNWYTCSSPKSPFTSTLMCARPVLGGRHALSNDRYSWYGADGKISHRSLQSGAEIRSVLSEAFGINVPEVPILHQKLDALIK